MLTNTDELRIETSTLCNYSCVMCPRDQLKRQKTTMSNQLFDLITDKARMELKHIRSITISGFGEFATDPDWRYKIEKSASLFDRLHVITNLSLLGISDLSFLLRFVSDLRISVYAVSDAVYHEVHHPPSRHRLEDIQAKIVYLTQQKNPGQDIVLNYLEIDENVHQTAQWIDFWKDRVDLIEVWKPHNWIDGRSYRVPCSHRLATCGRPFKGPIQVQVDGTVNVCCFDYNGELEIGDLKSEGFNAIFDGERMCWIQDKHRNKQADDIPQCRVCDQRNCLSCKSRHMLYNSRFDRKERVAMTSTEYENLQTEKE